MRIFVSIFFSSETTGSNIIQRRPILSFCTSLSLHVPCIDKRHTVILLYHGKTFAFFHRSLLFQIEAILYFLLDSMLYLLSFSFISLHQIKNSEKNQLMNSICFSDKIILGSGYGDNGD